MTESLVYKRRSFAIIKELLTDRESTLKLYAAGNSMRPMIKQGDILVVKSTPSERVRIGDIVVFDTGQELCVHRLIMKYLRSNNRYIFVTKSDKTFKTDMPFTDKKLIGRVVNIQKGGVILNPDSIFWTIVNRALGLCHLLLFWGRSLKGHPSPF